MLLPIAIGDYTDFFCSMHHAKNCGTIFRGPQNPIPANWFVNFGFFWFTKRKFVWSILLVRDSSLVKFNLISRFHLPIAYHGRASSIVISGTDIVRPRLVYI